MNITTGRPSTVRIKISAGDHYEEGRAAGAISPGHLIQRGSANTFVVHATAKGVAEHLLATEDVNVLQGKGVDDAFASGDLISYVPLRSGDKAMMLLKANENVAIGDKLVSAGNGQLQKWAANDVAASGNAETLTIPPNVALFIAEEASNVATVAKLIVRVI